MKKRAKPRYIWYVEPLDSSTNEIIARHIIEKDPFSEVHSIRFADGRKHNLWECDFRTAITFWRSRKSLSLKLKIFFQRERGKIKPCPSFLLKKRKTKTA